MKIRKLNPSDLQASTGTEQGVTVYQDKTRANQLAFKDETGLVHTMMDDASADITGVLADTVLNNALRNGMQIGNIGAPLTSTVTLTATEIVGTAAGDLGHAGGAELVAAPGAGFALQHISTILIYDYDTAAYTGGAGDDLTVFQNSVAVSGAVATADLITKAGDTVISMNALTTDHVLGVNTNINLASTAVTQPGTAAGVIRAITTYRVITTGL